MPTGIQAWGAYLPHRRLERAAIAAALGGPIAPGRRTVAAYDEDTTSMGVEAARDALVPTSPQPGVVLFSTPAPAYVDKTNATSIHAALHLGAEVGAFDLCGSVRSAWGATLAAASMAHTRPTLAIVADLRTGLPSSLDERASGDGAAAFLWSSDRLAAELVGAGSASEELLDRWRLPTESSSHLWDERFAERAYVDAGVQALGLALDAAGLDLAAVDHLIVAGLHQRAVRALTDGTGVRGGAVAADLTTELGNLGAAQAGIALADVLDCALPDQVVAVVQLADGADAMVLRTTAELPRAQAARRSTVAQQAAAGRSGLAYADFLTWRGMLDREPPRRPDPAAPVAPAARRREAWKFGFVASRCSSCRTRHLPPSRVCVKCHSVDSMDDEPVSDARGTIATFTVDRLAYSLAPPVVAVAVDFDGGGRLECELTDADASEVAVGDRVEMTFRRLFTSQAIHNYFWKARPVRS